MPTNRFAVDGWLYDMYLVDLASGKATNVSAVERVSFYNSSPFLRWRGCCAFVTEPSILVEDDIYRILMQGVDSIHERSDRCCDM